MFCNSSIRRGNYKQYHTSLKLFISAGGNSALAFDMGIPKSTVSSWKNADFTKLINHPVTGSAEKDLRLFQKFIKNRFAQRVFSVYAKISDTFHSILQSYTDSINSFKDSILPVINSTKYIIGIANILRIFRISRQRYDIWIKNKSCSASPFGLCLRQYPNQLDNTAVEKLKLLFSRFKIWQAMNSRIMSGSWPLVSIYFKGLRENLISFSLTTYYKYVKLLGLSDFSETIRKRPQLSGLRAIFPDQYWHADITIFRTMDNTNIYIYLVIDNFSRYILAWRASLEISAKTRWETLLEAYKFSTYNKTDPIKLIVDGGPENKPIPFDPAIPIKKLVAQQDVDFSNSMIEAANKQLKYRYLFTQNLFNFDDTVRYLEKSIPEYNNVRPYGVLKGLTPEEVYRKGMIPGKSMLDDRLRQAIEGRHLQNKLNLCPTCKD